MDCCKNCDSISERSVERKLNRKIEKELKIDKRNTRLQKKLLLLGTGESGKSTFIKQMHIIHKKGFSTDEERKTYIDVIHQNVLNAIQKIVRAMSVLNIEFESDLSREYSQLILDMNVSVLTDQKYVNAIKHLWSDSGIQECYNRRNEYQLTDSAKYYISDIERITSKEYIPSQQDILRARVPTTGINEYEFKLNSIIFRMVDVGGQRSERRKWIHCFEDITSIIFICALSEFDQNLNESVEVNRMEESKALFKTIVTCEWLQNSSIILFFNKYDLFEEKICSTSHLSDYFSDYSGPKYDPISGRQFIMNSFLEVIPELYLKRIIYSHFTCATNTQNIKFVFKAVKHTILEFNLRKEIYIF